MRLRAASETDRPIEALRRTAAWPRRSGGAFAAGATANASICFGSRSPTARCGSICARNCPGAGITYARSGIASRKHLRRGSGASQNAIRRRFPKARRRLSKRLRSRGCASGMRNCFKPDWDAVSCLSAQTASKKRLNSMSWVAIYWQPTHRRQRRKNTA